jgi:hypothetical protein
MQDNLDRQAKALYVAVITDKRRRHFNPTSWEAQSDPVKDEYRRYVKAVNDAL